MLHLNSNKQNKAARCGKLRNCVFSLLLCAGVVLNAGRTSAQTPLGQTSGEQAPASTLSGVLDLLQQTVQVTSTQLGRLRVDKWKADADTKSATQTRVDSLTRNMTSALPAVIEEARQKPQDTAVVFKLYRNLNALYDVLNSVTEAAGAFGSRQESDALASQASAFQEEQRAIADYLERLTAQIQSELAMYRTQQQARAVATPTKIIVDEQPTPRKTLTRKTRKSVAPRGSPTPQ